MLRAGLLIVALAVFAITLGVFAAGAHGVWPGVVWSGLIVVALLVERWRYAPKPSAAHDADWVKTDERFVDPESGRSVEVFYNPRTGERRYRDLNDPR
jgi:hypothetical protein